MKHDDGKPKLWQLLRHHPAAFGLLGLNRNYAAVKYVIGSGWRSVDNIAERALESAIRHLADPTALDRESGLPNLAHGVTQLLFASEYRLDGASIESGTDPIAMLHGLTDRQELGRLQQERLGKWAALWGEEKACVVADRRPILTGELLIDFRHSLTCMAKLYDAKAGEQPETPGQALNTALALLMGQSLSACSAAAAYPMETAAAFHAIKALELNYKNQDLKAFLG